MSERQFPTRTLLFVSLAVNLLVIGAVIGLALSGARLHRMAGGFGPSGRAFMGALPPEKAAEIRRRLDESWRTSAAERATAHEARLALLQAVQREPFDEAQVRGALAALRAADETLAAKNQDAVIGVLKDLSPPQRAAALGGLLRARFMDREGHGFGDHPPAGAMAPASDVPTPTP